MYIDEKTKHSIDSTLKKEYGISYSEFEKLDEQSQKIILENIKIMLDKNIEENEKYLEKITINEINSKKQGVK